MIAELTKRIQDTLVQLEKVDLEIGKNPDNDDFMLSYESLKQRLSKLKKEFAELTVHESVDVLEYRLFPEDSDHYPVSAIGGSITCFQDMITVVHDAFKYGPKQRKNVSKESEEASRFNFAYVYPGSLGIVMTIANEQSLLNGGESELDFTVGKILEILTEATSEKVKYTSERIGLAGIRSIYSWSDLHIRYRLSTDIKWKHGHSVRSSSYIGVHQLQVLSDIVRRTKDDDIVKLPVTGTLVGIDHELRKFHIISPDGDIKGDFAENFELGTIETPKTIRAMLCKRTVSSESVIDNDRVSWVLDSMELN